MLEVSENFCELLRKGDEEAAFALLTPENVNWRIEDEHSAPRTVLSEFLESRSTPDNPRVVKYVYNLGFQIIRNEDEDEYDDDYYYGLANAIITGKIKTARALSLYYPSTVNEWAYKECRYLWKISYALALIVVDLGYRTEYHDCPFLQHFESVRMLAIVTMGVIARSPPRSGGGGGDVARIIGRVIWESRALNFKRDE
jgi:hypothetical protein